jgi:hypothetical protein
MPQAGAGWQARRVKSDDFWTYAVGWDGSANILFERTSQTDWERDLLYGSTYTLTVGPYSESSPPAIDIEVDEHGHIYVAVDNAGTVHTYRCMSLNAGFSEV